MRQIGAAGRAVTAPLVPLAAAVWASGAAGPARETAALAATAALLAAIAVFPAVFWMSRLRAAGAGVAIAGVAVAAGAWCARAQFSGFDATAYAWITIATLGVLLGVTGPLWAVGARTPAAICWLVVACAITATPWLLSTPPPSPLPDIVLAWNPVARIGWHCAGIDWFHQPGLYPKLGTVYYRYPSAADGLIVPFVIAAAGLVIATLLELGRVLARRCLA